MGTVTSLVTVDTMTTNLSVKNVVRPLAPRGGLWFHFWWVHPPVLIVSTSHHLKHNSDLASSCDSRRNVQMGYQAHLKLNEENMCRLTAHPIWMRTGVKSNVKATNERLEGTNNR